MQIIIVGCGNVGTTLTEQLSKEGHDLTVIDSRSDVVQGMVNHFDVRGVVGNGASYSIQMDAGVESADLLIAVTESDELNLLCCLFARKTGNCQTIARVREPIYNQEAAFIKKELELSMVINPEHIAAMEMARLLKFPAALEINTFAKGKVELVKYRIEEGSILCNLPLKDVAAKMHCSILISIVERGEEVYIPSGNFILRARDEISVIGSTKNMILLFKKLGQPTTRAKSAMIVGGGEIAFYLTKELLAVGTDVKIIEKSKKRCLELSESLPQAMVICGDGTDRELLLQEGLESTDSFLSLTNIDEENIVLSLFARKVSRAKLITKVHRISFDEIVGELEIGSVIYPKYITAECIVCYVRAMHNSLDSDIETLYQINEKTEALEFLIKSDCPAIGKTLEELDLKPNILIGMIQHKGNIIIPTGQSTIEAGDTVVVITTITGVSDISDILK